ncbi:hypothetical protein NDI52_24315 [Leptolyngbya sp. PL-A3]|uniref:hypothetical protein n=1 Tax=Leptolyngbya sp. PL-A3 TaxID=2933911 RepID=UPI0016887671|nr:hypothetical protein [Leptolyngbya sp. FACHB-16]
MRVLIIEEGFSDCPNVEAILQQSHKVVTVATVETGLKFIRKERPDMVFWGPHLAEKQADAVLATLSAFNN